MKSPRPTGWIALLLRVLLGALFIFAAFMKLRDPQQFAFAVSAFKILPDHLVILATFVVPWTELIAGTALVLGFWTRSAAVLLALLLGVFLAGIGLVLYRHMDNVNCSCFGKFEVPCKGPIGWCHVVRNSVLILLALTTCALAPGPLAIDRESTR